MLHVLTAKIKDWGLFTEIQIIAPELLKVIHVYTRKHSGRSCTKKICLHDSTSDIFLKNKKQIHSNSLDLQSS